VPHVVGQRPNIVVAMDWTDFDDDNLSIGVGSGPRIGIQKGPL
jgi:hypothetical protein